MVEHESPFNRDDEWARLFAAANVELPGDDFIVAVLHRVRRRLLIRRTVLGAALAVGALLAIGPALYFVAIARMGLELLADQWGERQWYAQYALPIAILFIGIGWPALVRWLAR